MICDVVPTLVAAATKTRRGVQIGAVAPPRLLRAQARPAAPAPPSLLQHISSFVHSLAHSSIKYSPHASCRASSPRRALGGPGTCLDTHGAGGASGGRPRTHLRRTQVPAVRTSLQARALLQQSRKALNSSEDCFPIWCQGGGARWRPAGVEGSGRRAGDVARGRSGAACAGRRAARPARQHQVRWGWVGAWVRYLPTWWSARTCS